MTIPLNAKHVATKESYNATNISLNVSAGLK